MRAIKARLGAGVCVGACVAISALMSASAAGAETTLSLCMPTRETATIKTPTKGGCEKNYTLITFQVEGKEGKEGKPGPTGAAGATGETGATGPGPATTGPTGPT